METLSQQKDCTKFIIIILFYKLHYQNVFVINTEFESIALSHVELEHTNTNQGIQTSQCTTLQLVYYYFTMWIIPGTNLNDYVKHIILNVKSHTLKWCVLRCKKVKSNWLTMEAREEANIVSFLEAGATYWLLKWKGYFSAGGVKYNGVKID